MSDIWIGLAGAVPVDPDDPDSAAAFVHVVAPADDEPELRAAAAEALSEQGFRLTELDEAEPLRDRLRAGSLAPELMELALDAALDGVTQLGQFFEYSVTPQEEPDLGALIASKELVNVRGPGEQHDTIGYVVAMGAHWVLMQLVDSYGEAGGFRAIRHGTVAEIEAVDPDGSFLPRLLDARPLTPQLPDVDLHDTRGLLQSAQRLSKLVYIATEEMEPDAFWIGRISALEDDGVLLRKVSPVATWVGEELFGYDALTRIGFGGGYEDALAAAVGTVSD